MILRCVYEKENNSDFDRLQTFVYISRNPHRKSYIENDMTRQSKAAIIDRILVNEAKYATGSAKVSGMTALI